MAPPMLLPPWMMRPSISPVSRSRRVSPPSRPNTKAWRASRVNFTEAWERSPKPSMFLSTVLWVVSTSATLPVARSITTPRSPVPRSSTALSARAGPMASSDRAPAATRVFMGRISGMGVSSGESVVQGLQAVVGLQVLGHPAGLLLAEKGLPAGHGGAGDAVADDMGERLGAERLHALLGQGGAEAAAQGHAVAGATVLVEQGLQAVGIHPGRVAARLCQGRLGQQLGQAELQQGKGSLGHVGTHGSRRWVGYRVSPRQQRGALMNIKPDACCEGAGGIKGYIRCLF